MEHAGSGHRPGHAYGRSPKRPEGSIRDTQQMPALNQATSREKTIEQYRSKIKELRSSLSGEQDKAKQDEIRENIKNMSDVVMYFREEPAPSGANVTTAEHTLKPGPSLSGEYPVAVPNRPKRQANTLDGDKYHASLLTQWRMNLKNWINRRGEWNKQRTAAESKKPKRPAPQEERIGSVSSLTQNPIDQVNRAIKKGTDVSAYKEKFTQDYNQLGNAIGILRHELQKVSWKDGIFRRRKRAKFDGHKLINPRELLAHFEKTGDRTNMDRVKQYMTSLSQFRKTEIALKRIDDQS